jgi:uncharacterized protein (TIGR01777 family)
VRILLTGASGLIGRNLAPRLRAAGHEVIRLVRRPPNGAEPGTVHFDARDPDVSLPDGFDAVVHLAGANVARRWTRRARRVILESRADFTAALCGALARTTRPPAHFICSSGVNFYGTRPVGVLTEESPTGDGFLAEVCRKWEAATGALGAGVRVAHLRTAVVLSAEGGALKKLLTPFRFGLGAVMGSGEQFMSWVAMPDALAAIEHVLNTPGLSGAVNLTGPSPVTNREFTKTLARVLHRPALFRFPAGMLKVGFGRMADETILASHRATPAKLLASGFEFKYPQLEPALRELLTTGK